MIKIKDDAWVISDTHFGHANIIKYADRPFRSVEEMDNALIKNWNSVVGKQDQVLFLGDFSFAGCDKTLEYRNALNGDILFLLGNHDRTRLSAWMDRVSSHRIDHPIIYRDFFILSHEPIEWVSERIPILNIHGHEHEKTAYNLSNNHFNVSVEAIDYTPILLLEIIDKAYPFQNPIEYN